MNTDAYDIDYIESLVELEETDNEKFCAIKVAEREGLSSTNEAIIVEECLNQSQVKSEHVVELFSAIKTENRYYLMLEYCNGGDLMHLMLEKDFNISGWAIHKIMT